VEQAERTERAVSGRLDHFAEFFGQVHGPSRGEARRPALALTAEGPRRSDLIAWAGAHAGTLSRMRLLAPAGIGALLSEHVGLATETLRSGTVGPAATAGLAAAGGIDAMIAFTDPIELRPGDTTTRSLTRLALFWDIPIAGNRATADLLLATITAVHPSVSTVDLPDAVSTVDASGGSPATRTEVRLWMVRATVDDVPGRLAVLAASLARRAINILSVQVHLTPDGPVDELLVSASPVLSAAELTAAVIDGGARTPRVCPADAHALVDAPTRALTLAARLVRTPDDLAGVLASLLPGACLVWRAEAPDGHEDNLTQLWLADPAGGGFLLTRPAAPFTPAECARAFAMVDVAVAALVGPTPASDEADLRLMLADGTEIAVRRAGPDDVAAVADLHARCSPTSRSRRYLADTRSPSEPTLRRLLSPEAGHALVAEDAAGRVIALANLTWVVDGAEMALLVEDAWQGRRIGSLLAKRLVAVALEAGVSRIRAKVHTGNTPVIRIMTGLAHRLHREYDEGMLTLIATVVPAHLQRSPSSRRLAHS
jgi:methylglyoxal synthase/GNAT superfamily N-acetyltransferase